MPSGSRVLSMNKLAEAIEQLSSHSATCGGRCQMESERRFGLATVLHVRCTACHSLFKINSCEHITERGGRKWAVNLGAVWGQLVTGGGAAHLAEMLAYMDVPSMSKQTFKATEELLGKAWNELLEEEMKAAGQEERHLALERKDFHEGVPAITVVMDSGWSKRSHKHSYSAKFRVAVIIGKATKRLLHLAIGVRSKFCSVCSHAQNLSVKPVAHTCFKDWNSSSTAMESDVIVEEFWPAETTHGLRYMSFIGDGDSSVHCDIRTKVPGWGRMVQKIKCANHSVKGAEPPPTHIFGHGC